ncbi:uncharacterized protein ACA1_324860 [Acanthamoeba castellanii str. Neff]|uniref:Uncharacterized protein n=1 Tax=Acanthamoeba castellanii (strain ATCC 30010 / Neff) TaxID=1257118 RepID=L8GHV1_ACACF|nr:uncharacterized protein ACA1_324860 [Acanthamoeba castellanii str. Neff]ELR12439.1 hypothetical protein ACA1_324860 [Acanthamoeba castellanii str. Neff]
MKRKREDDDEKDAVVTTQKSSKRLKVEPKSVRPEKIAKFQDIGHCNICFKESQGRTLVTGKNGNAFVRLCDVSRVAPFALTEKGIVITDILYAGPCGKHLICGDCLMREAAMPTWQADRCISLDGTCEPRYPKTLIRRVYKMVGMKPPSAHPRKEKKQRCQQPGKNGRGHCSGNMEPLTDLKHKQCTKCRIVTCDHCNTPVRLKRATNSAQHVSVFEDCRVCYVSTKGRRYMVPEAFNPYFVRRPQDPPASPLDPSDLCHMLRNRELTLDIVVDQMWHIMSADRLFTPCPCCLWPMQKTSQCSEMTHCRIKRCYVCGIMSKKDASFIGTEHWDRHGKNGCTRFLFLGQPPFALYGRRAAVLDFNGDGKADLLLSGPRDTTAAQHTLTPTTTHAGSVSLILG